MNKVIAVTQRELKERSFVFIAAAALTAVPFIVANIPGIANDRKAAITLLATFLAVGFSIALALALGTSIIGRDLSEKRISFYFSRPLSGSAIWFGKLLASAIAIVGCFAILILPQHLVYRATPVSLPELAGVTLAICAGGLLLSHVLSTMIRSRSKMIALDFIAAIVFLGALGSALMPLLLHGAMRLTTTMLAAVVVATAVAVIAAGAWQVSRGRVDRLRNHNELSRFLWLSLGGILLVVVLFASWVRSADVHDIRGYVSASADYDQPWHLVGGAPANRGDYNVLALYDIESGRAVERVGWLHLSISHDGKVAIWGEPVNALGSMVADLSTPRWLRAGESKVMLARLDQPKPEVIDTGITLPSRSTSFLSPAGSRFATVANDTLSVYDIASRRSLGSVRVPIQPFRHVRFTSEDVVRIYSRSWAKVPKLLVYEFDTRTRKLAQLVDMPMEGKQTATATTSDGSRLLTHSLQEMGPTVLRLIELPSGRVLATITSQGRFGSSWLMADGRIAAMDNVNGAITLRVYGPDGVPQRELPLGQGARTRIAAEPAPGKLVVAVTHGHSGTGTGWTTHMVDVDAQRVTATLRNVIPVWGGFFTTGATFAHAKVQALHDQKGALLRWDTSTGEVKKLLGG